MVTSCSPSGQVNIEAATFANDAVELTAGSRIEIDPLENVQCQSSTAPVQSPSSLANLVLIGLQRRIGLAAGVQRHRRHHVHGQRWRRLFRYRRC